MIAGILSMQRVPNYGSFLQAYALKQLLLDNGIDEVYFIDIREGIQLYGLEYNVKQTKLNIILRAIKYFLKGERPLFPRTKDLEYIKKRDESIINNFSKLGLDEKYTGRFDIVFIGSDEVFNCCQRSKWGYSLQLFGDIPNAKKVVSYAGSFGHTTLELLQKFGIDEEIGNAMKSLFSISVRDDNSFEIVKKITGLEPQMHLDPVLIYGYKDIISTAKTIQYSNYILIYSYQGRIRKLTEIKSILNFAKRKNLKLFSIFCQYDWCDRSIIPETPFDVLKWFKNACYVITDTFHGSIFSIITQSKFCTLIRTSNSQKLTSLLSKLNLLDRVVCHSDKIKEVLEKTIDFESTNAILENERNKSIEYIKSCIKGK